MWDPELKNCLERKLKYGPFIAFGDGRVSSLTFLNPVVKVI